MPEDEYHFRGFSKPTYTQVPDELFDELMPRLSESELKVLLYVIRRTYGFKKDTDNISLKQMVEGIRTRDGRQLDNGTGLSRPGVTKGVKGLVGKGVLLAVRNTSVERGDEPTTYSLRFADPVETSLPRGRQNRFDPDPYNVSPLPRNSVAPQETVEQQIEEQETDPSNSSNDPSIVMSREETERIAWVIRDVSRELGDNAPVKSSATRAANLYARSGLELSEFLDLVQAARVRTKRYTGSIKAERNERGVKPKMSYMFGILEDLLTG